MAKRNEWKPLMDAVQAAGWTYRASKHGTYVYPAEPGVRPVTIPGTPGDYRSLRNTRAQLRRAGLTGV
ncbi:hypothetical protein CH293_26525 [Rhodococcus sp. 14-2470-1b]|uniref:hypothetical protein n=1 Tax=Rhodococcus sp. 14-2470-1b TaxID=2023149 RepID=UPI000B9C110B|nr:hypothetical protein [Rhodococcus sp. 14-2470-1b]OZF42285.1 hypothetical protein CH293_26525 [Rhodococcus sp. 14-2470-1b]